jgi:hypothetical protein
MTGNISTLTFVDQYGVPNGDSSTSYSGRIVLDIPAYDLSLAAPSPASAVWEDEEFDPLADDEDDPAELLVAGDN